MMAWCFADGTVHFSAQVPARALAIARMPDGQQFSSWRKFIEGSCRLAYDGTYLVPGVPEAPDQLAAVDALAKFSEWLERHTMKEMKG